MARPKKYTEIFIQKEGKALLTYAKKTAIPFEKEFASQRGYSSQRLSEFANTSEEFSEALKRMKDLQEVKIIKAGLTGKINSTVAIFTLKNVAGWRDSFKVDPQCDPNNSALPDIHIHLAKESDPIDKGENNPINDPEYPLLKIMGPNGKELNHGG